jgi:Flp pilus assembly protein TadD
MRRTRYRTFSSHLRGALRALNARRDWHKFSVRFQGLFGDIPNSDAKSESLNTLWADDPIASYLQKSNESLDLSFGIFLISQESYPEYFHEDYKVSLRKMAADLKLALNGARTAREKVDRMSEFIFGKLGFVACDAQDTESLVGNLLLPEVIRRRRGHCLGLSSLYLVLSSLVKLPIYGVAAPGHFFCRYDDGQKKFNIEMTLRGAQWSDELYAERYGLSRSAIEKGTYLRSLSKLEVLVEILNNRGNYYWRRGRQDAAARDIGRVTKASRGFARGYAGKGFMALCRGQIVAAVLELGRAVEIDPWSARATLHLGEALLEFGKIDRAVAALRRAVKLDAKQSFGWSMLGRALAQQGRLEEAYNAHEQAISLDPGSCLAWNNYGVFLAFNHDIERAVNAFVQAIEQSHDFPTAAANLAKLKNHGLLYDFEWVVDEVIEGYEQDIEQRPADYRSYLCLCRFLYELNIQENRALVLAEKARALCEDAASCEMLALLTYRRQEFAQTRYWALRGLSLFPAARSRRRLRSLLTQIDQLMQVVYEH